MRRVLITGGTRGVGLNLAKMFDSEGCHVTLTGTNQINAERTAASISSQQSCQKSCQSKYDINRICCNKHSDNYDSTEYHIGYQLDLSNLESINNFCNQISSQNFDVVIHNAGMLSRDSLMSVTDSRQLKMFMVNVIGPMAITRSVLPNMIKNKSGNILFFCPEYAIDEKTSILTPYMQTKLAQTTFMKSLANMNVVKKSNIKVAGFWTRYGLHTDALTYRQIGKKENCMDPSIISKMVELLLEEPQSKINGKVFNDYEYLTSKGVDLNQFKLGDDVLFLDKLFLDSLNKKN